MIPASYYISWSLWQYILLIFIYVPFIYYIHHCQYSSVIQCFYRRNVSQHNECSSVSETSLTPPGGMLREDDCMHCKLAHHSCRQDKKLLMLVQQFSVYAGILDMWINILHTRTNSMSINMKALDIQYICLHPKKKKEYMKTYTLLIVWHAIQLWQELMNKESYGCSFCFSFFWFGLFVLHVWLQFQLIPMLFAFFYIIHVESLVKTHRYTPPHTHTTSISLNRIHAVQPSPQSKAQLTG